MGRTRHPFKVRDYTMHESYPPASKASREVANLTELKICVPPFMVSKNLSVGWILDPYHLTNQWGSGIIITVI